MAHVFTLLSIVLPPEPLRIAYRGLHTNDTALRGTALEYLESVLPADVREALWPFIEGGQRRASRWLRRVRRCLPVWSRRTRRSSSTFRHTHRGRARAAADRTREGSPVPDVAAAIRATIE